MQINTRIGHAVAAGFLCSVSSFAAWQAGTARVDITPSQSIWMGGYAARTHPSEGIRQHIFVKALALKDKKGAVTVLVTSDLLGFPGEVSAPIFSRVQQQFGLARERVVLNSSHDHSAPVVGHMLSPAYPYGEAEMKVVRAFTTKLQDQVVEAIGKAIQNLAPRNYVSLLQNRYLKRELFESQSISFTENTPEWVNSWRSRPLEL
jgi:neutral ceramidase